MSSSKRQKTTSSQAGDNGQQTINARSVAARLRWEKKRQEKQEQMEREAKLKFEQQIEIERQEFIRREREQHEYNERVLKEQLARQQLNARPENQFIADRKKARRMEGQSRRRFNENEQKREENRNRLLTIRSEGSGQGIEQQEGEHIKSPLDAQKSDLCGGEINLGGSREQLMLQQTQGDGDDKEYRLRVMEEKQRQTQQIYFFIFQLFSQQPCTQYILGESKAKKYNEKRKAERASKKEPVQKVKSIKQVSSVRSAAQKARREKEAAEKEKETADMGKMTGNNDADTVRKLDLIPKARVRVQPETLYASLTKEEKYNILLRRGQIKEQVLTGQQDGVSNGGNTPKQGKMVRFLYEF
ncbi:hypothetical protein MKX03_004605 [Papaver bracteatum]|nr:hypothetical protein MKX03_004605 [Papaver bracteatum]